MFRIDNSTALTALPVAGPPLAPGYFTDGNPGTGLPATIVDAWWCNMLQEEILTVISHAGITPNKTSTHQLFDALQMLYTPEGQTGAFLPLAGGTLTGKLTIDIASSGANMLWFQAPDVSVIGGGLWRAGIDSQGGLNVQMNTSALGDFSTYANYLNLSQTTHSVSIGYPLSVNGNLTASGAVLTVSGASIAGGLYVSSGDTTLIGRLAVTQGASFQNGVSIPAGGLGVTGNTGLTGTLYVTSTITTPTSVNCYSLSVNQGGDDTQQTVYITGNVHITGNGTTGLFVDNCDIFTPRAICAGTGMAGQVAPGCFNSAGGYFMNGVKIPGSLTAAYMDAFVEAPAGSVLVLIKGEAADETILRLAEIGPPGDDGRAPLLLRAAA